MPKRERRKRRVLSTILIVFGAIIGLLALVSVIGLAATEPERREGRNLPIAAVDFKTVPDGGYRGRYAGGRWGWRANEVQVTVNNGQLTSIEVVDSKVKPVPAQVTAPLFDRVIKAQSLQVDTISQATITSKSFLKSVENALADAH
jgi:uncharacterized protein with FMN-binding domain